ncbi:hypothetical protein [Aliirhizobium smilacinae]|uniref:Lipoprotein n=1 Tax=Aliirhizobium smilacinae TaxID=1395944 RepID=A0A5C4XKT9_9HYPH|nr:hypothetical protein [Rhizobium smilacinae]TNM63531.1 hypothetical protein FHP24_12025 [Rhizobium smilacinae]
MKTNRMTQTNKAAFSVGGAVLVALTFAGCTTDGKERYEERHRCFDSGSPNHDSCMYMQQVSRDREQLMNMERARINSEQARNNLEMLREIRRRRGE